MKSELAKQNPPRQVQSSLATAVALLVVVGALVVFGVALPGEARAGPPPCSVTVHTENGADNAIQSAINTYPGGVICVGPGTFPEQLTISSSNTVLRGAGPSKTIIEPNAPLTLNTHDYNQIRGLTTESAAAIILVEGPSGDPSTGVSGVTIENLQANGFDGQSTFTDCSDEYFGVDFQNSSGVLTDAHVVGLELPSPLFCYATGVGIYAYHGAASFPSSIHTLASVTVSHTVVSSYEWTGIICSDVNVSCSLSSNTITGLGPTDQVPQSGIAIYGLTLATISHNSVSGNTYTGGLSPNNDWYIGTQAVGIGLFPSGTGSTASYNHVWMNQVGISFGGGYPVSSVTIAHNNVDTSGAYGIVATGAFGAPVSANINNNTINNRQSLDPSVYGAPGILLDGGTYVVAHNKIEGSLSTAGASNGVNQTVCGPTDPVFCSSVKNITTAAVQVASSNGATYVTLDENSYPPGTNTYKLATLVVFGNPVDVVEL